MGLLRSSNEAAAGMAQMLIWMFLSVLMLPYQFFRVAYLMTKRSIMGNCKLCGAMLPWSGPCRGKYHPDGSSWEDKEPACRICGATTGPCDAGLHG